jgi:hypothetical protein
MDTDYSNLDTSANIPLINELTDFLATEAAELAANEDVNDESLTPTNLDALDYKPVSIVHLRNTRNNKIQQKPLMVLFDTGAQKSTVKAKHSHFGKVRKTARPTTFSAPHSKFQTNLMSEMQFNMPEFSESKQRVNHTYSVGDYAYVLKDGVYRKLEGDKLGPYRVTEVFTNNTVRIQKGIMNERINIRRLSPHFGQPPN